MVSVTLLHQPQPTKHSKEGAGGCSKKLSQTTVQEDHATHRKGAWDTEIASTRAIPAKSFKSTQLDAVILYTAGSNWPLATQTSCSRAGPAPGDVV